MSEKEKNKTFGQRLKSALDAKLIALVVLVIWQVGEGFYLNYQAGAEAKKYEEFKVDAQKVIEEEIALPNLLKKVIDSDFVKDFADKKKKEIEAKVINQVLADSNEVNFITLLGQETGLRDEVVEQKFKAMFKLYVEGELLTAQEVKDLIARRRISHTW